MFEYKYVLLITWDLLILKIICYVSKIQVGILYSYLLKSDNLELKESWSMDS